MSFFRIPEFRDKFLGIILEKSKGKIEEWRNTEGMSLDDDGEDEEYDPLMSRIFDWKTFFYDHIPQVSQDAALEIL